MNILICKSIFCPDNEQLNVTINSIEFMTKYLKDSDIIIDYYFVGWCMNKYRDTIINFIKNKKINHSILFFDINLGKYEIINKIIEKISDRYNYFIYFDHDIIIQQDFYNRLHKIGAIMMQKINDKPIGLLAFDQLDDNRHSNSAYNNQCNNICYPDDNIYGAVADGAFVGNIECFKDIEKLQPMSAYGMDDYYLSKKIKDNKYLCCIINDIYVQHPYEKNDKYKKWKKYIVEKTINSSENIYFLTVEDASNFWN